MEKLFKKQIYFKILFHKMKVAKMNYHGIKDNIVVLQVSVCVDHSNIIKCAIHI